MHHPPCSALIAALLTLIVSCAKPPRDVPRPSKSRALTTQTPAADPDDQLINRVLAAYRGGGYSDRAELTLTYQFPGGRRETSITAYRTWFKATPGDNQIAPPRPKLHPPAGTKQLQIQRLWTTKDISEPGNMLLIPVSGYVVSLDE